MKTTQIFKEEVNSIFNTEYTVIGEYTGTNNKILLRHNVCGNEFEMCPNNFLRGSRCPKCSRKNGNIKKTKTTETFKKEVKDICNDEFTVLGEYTGLNNEIPMKHNICGNEFKITPNNFLHIKNKCPYCKNVNFKTSLAKDTQYFKDKIYNLFGEEFELVGDYINQKHPIKIRHNVCGNEFEILPSNFLSRHNCPKCSNYIGKKNTESFKKELQSLLGDDYILMNEYVNNRTKVRIKHNVCGNEYEIRPVDILHPNSRGVKTSNRGCKYCNNNGTSFQEIKLREYISSIIGTKYEIRYNDRSVLSNKQELDIYIPELKIAIEYDGLFWHSNENGRDKNYHLNKTLECDNLGIRLIHIFDDEWLNKQSIVKSKLSNILQSSYALSRIYARKCYVEEIDNNYKTEFLNLNHIQGNDTSLIKLGLWYPSVNGDILVAVMTFCKPRKSLGQGNNTTYDYELSRFATDIDYIVNGGFGKLFKFFKDNYQWNKIITYADRRWSQGDVCIKNKWVLDHSSHPNYWYYNKNTLKRYHRYNFRKSELQKLFPEVYNENKTEFQIMEDTNVYTRVYDCGNLVFYYNKNS